MNSLRTCFRLALLTSFILWASPATFAQETPKKLAPVEGNVASDGKIKDKLSAADQHKEFRLPRDFVIELVAEDPTLINPVTMTLDGQGRILVSESHTYRYGPKGSPVTPFKNPVVRLDPIPGGKGWTRTVIADGFDDPVMGIVVRGDKLWLTANNFLYQYDYPASGPATNKKTIVTDKNKAWNPFGMFVLEDGPDGWLYLSVGNHAIDLQGPTNKVTGRGGSGIVVRMKPDGSEMERLVHGLRVPYSFEADPFGQLWLLSNGEGNPNRFVKVIPGVDYHCYSRSKSDNAWLIGQNPLSPPCFELLRGAHTQLMRYYGAAYPAEYQGSLLLDNWGAHGFHGPNRGIFRYVPDARGQIVEKQPFVWCNDPHFRPAHICLDPDGNLLIADWYGRDDESDTTGRIWRVRYTGKVEPVTRLPEQPTKQDLLAALGSRSHSDRDRAMAALSTAENRRDLAEVAAKSDNAMAAANALWCLVRVHPGEVLAGVTNPDPRVRRLALELSRRFKVDAAKLAQAALTDPDPAVRLEAALTLGTAGAIRQVVVGEVATDPHLRYQAAAELAKLAKAEDFSALLTAKEPGVRLAGLIALDVAMYEKTDTAKAALVALTDALNGPASDDFGQLLFLAQAHTGKELLAVFEKISLREDLPPAITGRALVVHGALGGKILPESAKTFLDRVRRGKIELSTAQDQTALLDLLEAEGPSPLALELLGKAYRTVSPTVRPQTLTLARKFGAKAEPFAGELWPALLKPNAKIEDALDALATIALIQSPAPSESWAKLLAHEDPLVRTEAVRWFRAFKKQPEMLRLLVERVPDLVKADPKLKDDLATVLRDLGGSSPAVPVDDGKRDKAELTRLATDSLAGHSTGDRQKHALLGRGVFERFACVKCHTAVNQNTPLAPSLKGIGLQKIDYLIESILHPSKIIKTGFEMETIVTKAGKVHNGLVKDEGTHLRIQNADLDQRIDKKEVEQRSTNKVSIMPEGQEVLLSRQEFVDLIAYLATLK